MNANNDFFWALGMENTFVPQTRAGLRALDEYELTQHYQLWREDIDRMADVGISHMRWGIPWYRVNPQPGQFEWDWVDEVLEHMVIKKGIEPIIDLMHYGTTLWMENSFLNSNYPQWVAEYAQAVAERYSSMVRFYTPLNEPTVNAAYCGRQGVWPPYLQGEDGYIKVLLALVRGMALTAAALREADPDAVFVQVEALGWVWSGERNLEPAVDEYLSRIYLSLDLATGRITTEHGSWPYLREHGVTERDLAWLQSRPVPVDILGVNLYPWSGGRLTRDREGRLVKQEELNGHHLASVLRHAWKRYGMPMMVTETSARRSVQGRAQWMDETIAAVCQVRDEEIPVLGYTWFPAITMIDWLYRTSSRPLSDYLLHLGLWEASFDEAGVLQRQATPLVDHYRDYVMAGVPRVGATTADEA